MEDVRANYHFSPNQTAKGIFDDGGLSDNGLAWRLTNLRRQWKGVYLPIMYAVLLAMAWYVAVWYVGASAAGGSQQDKI
jgi:hypothetical protein